MAPQREVLLRDAWNIQKGFRPGEPVFELYKERLTGKAMLKAFLAALDELGEALVFDFDPLVDPADEFKLSLLVEGLRVVDSAPYSAIRGGPWEPGRAYWMLTGWAQVYREGAGAQDILVAGVCQMLTPAGSAEDEVPVCPPEVGFTAQFIPASTVDPSAILPKVDRIEQLWA